MLCPKDEQPLETKQVGLHDVQVDECPDCGGTWLDKGELQQLSDGPAQLAAARWAAVDTKRRLKCPRCADHPELMPVGPADDPDLTLDHCRYCDGYWLDGGELQRMRERQFKRAEGAPEDKPRKVPFGEWLSSLFDHG